MVLHVPAREHAGHAGALPPVGQDVALFVQVDLVPEESGIGRMPDSDEEALGVQHPYPVRFQFLYAHAGHAGGFITQHLVDHGSPLERYLWMFQRPFLHDPARPQFVAAVNDPDLACEPRQEESFLHGAVASAHHGDLPVPVEGAVAGRTGGNAPSEEGILARYVEQAGRRTCTDHRGFRRVFAPVRAYPVGSRFEINRDDFLVLHHGAETLGLFPHTVHEIHAPQALGESREVLDLAGKRQLSADRAARQYDGGQVRPGRIQCRRVTRRPPADDDDLLRFSGFLVHLFPFDAVDATGFPRRRATRFA